MIFDETEYYDTYDETALLKEAEKANFIEFRAMDPRPTFETVDSDDEDWLDTPVRDRLVAPEPSTSGEGVRDGAATGIRDDDDDQPAIPRQLETPNMTPFTTPEPMLGKFTGDGRVSRFHPQPPPRSSIEEALTPPSTRLLSEHDPISNPNINQKRKGKARKGAVIGPDQPQPEMIGVDQLPETGLTPLDITERRKGSSADLDEANVIEGKRPRRPNPRYANAAVWAETEEMKLPSSHAAFYAFHASFLAGANKISPKGEDQHLNNLPSPPSNWRAMLRHPHVEGFMKAANAEYSALESRGTWEIIDQKNSQVIQPVPLKWVFTYKFNENGYLSKYKARLVVRGDLQEMSTQDVYAATLAFKVFRSLMALTAAFGLETRQLDAVNAFLNAKNDDPVYCFLPDGYRKPGKVMKIRVFPVECRIRLNAAISKITPSPPISLSIVDYLITMDPIEAGLAALRLKDESNIRATARKFGLIESTLRRRYNRQIVSMKRTRFLIHHRLFQTQKRILIIQLNRLIDCDIPSTTRMMRNFAKKIVKSLVDKN